MVEAFKSYKPHKNSTATVVKGGALSRSMTESHEKITFFNDASWKVYFLQKLECSLHCTQSRKDSQNWLLGS
jgi:hypothetical protein